MGIFDGWGESCGATTYSIKHTPQQEAIANSIKETKGKLKRDDIELVLNVMKKNGMSCFVKIKKQALHGQLYLYGYSTTSKVVLVEDHTLDEDLYWLNLV